MENIWAQFLTLTGLHLLAVASPGPDFALIVRQSVTHGRGVAVASSWGIGCGILVHTAYSLLGFGLLVRTSETWFLAMKVVGAGYLFWLGWRALRTKAAPGVSEPSGPSHTRPPGERRGPSLRSAFLAGFLTNATNVKATLFFVSIFTVVIDPRTPVVVQVGYGLWMALATGAWFTLVGRFFAQERVRRLFLRFGHWFERLMGAMLIGLAVRLVVSSR